MHSVRCMSILCIWAGPYKNYQEITNCCAFFTLPVGPKSRSEGTFETSEFRTIFFNGLLLWLLNFPGINSRKMCFWPWSMCCSDPVQPPIPGISQSVPGSSHSPLHAILHFAYFQPCFSFVFSLVFSIALSLVLALFSALFLALFLALFFSLVF